MEPDAKPTTATVKPQAEMLADIIATLYAPIMAALVTAYEAGKAEGGQRSREEMTMAVQKVMNHAFAEMLSGRVTVEALVAKAQAAPPVGPSPPPPLPLEPAQIARGSAKPAVLANLRRMPEGVSAKRLFQMMRHTGIKENTVRGTLNKLRLEGLTAKTGELWFVTRNGPQPSVSEAAHQ